MEKETVNQLLEDTKRIWPLSVPAWSVNDVATLSGWIARESATKKEAAKFIYDEIEKENEYFSGMEIDLDEFTHHLIQE